MTVAGCADPLEALVAHTAKLGGARSGRAHLPSARNTKTRPFREQREAAAGSASSLGVDGDAARYVRAVNGIRNPWPVSFA